MCNLYSVTKDQAAIVKADPGNDRSNRQFAAAARHFS
jgi:hypothetical protein